MFKPFKNQSFTFSYLNKSNYINFAILDKDTNIRKKRKNVIYNIPINCFHLKMSRNFIFVYTIEKSLDTETLFTVLFRDWGLLAKLYNHPFFLSFEGLMSFSTHSKGDRNHSSRGWMVYKSVSSVNTAFQPLGSLNDCKIKFIEKNTFNFMLQLTNLSLARNKITSIENDSFVDSYLNYYGRSYLKSVSCFWPSILRLRRLVLRGTRSWGFNSVGIGIAAIGLDGD